jgi:hypothetical protein
MEAPSSSAGAPGGPYPRSSRVRPPGAGARSKLGRRGGGGRGRRGAHGVGGGARGGRRQPRCGRRGQQPAGCSLTLPPRSHRDVHGAAQCFTQGTRCGGAAHASTDDRDRRRAGAGRRCRRQQRPYQGRGGVATRHGRCWRTRGLPSGGRGCRGADRGLSRQERAREAESALWRRNGARVTGPWRIVPPPRRHASTWRPPRHPLAALRPLLPHCCPQPTAAPTDALHT